MDQVAPGEFMIDTKAVVSAPMLLTSIKPVRLTYIDWP